MRIRTARRDGLRTPSLRRRVVAVVLLALAVLLVVLVLATDQALSARLESQLRERLTDRAGFAAALSEEYDGDELVRRLEGDGISVRLVDEDGETYSAGPVPPGGPGPGPRVPGGPDPDRVLTRGDLLEVAVDLDGDGVLVLAADSSSVAATVTQVRLVLVATALLVLLLAGLAVPVVVSRALAPLDRITEVARSITRGDRGRRLDPTVPTSELGRTATAFDEMLDEVVGAEQRARASEQRLRTFLSDAAHDLRTPITGVQAAAEHVLRDDPPRDERERVLTTLIRESRRAGRLVDDMLLITTIDAGLQLRREPVDLQTLARDVVAARELSHPGVELRAAGEAVTVPGDRDRLARALGNLVDNALGVARSTVVVTVRSGGGRAGFEVDDDGPGVPPADRERVFDRMVRLDGSRRSGGAGLGLPIARGIARAHGGDVTCHDVATGPGARFSLVLPSS